MNNNIDEPMTTKSQYEKFKRSIGIVLSINITPDNYAAIMQLMNELPNTATLILDETHEDL